MNAPLPARKPCPTLPTPEDMLRMPYDGRDVPHVVIEVNQKCNISCMACYKDKLDYTKPLEQIKSEIDLAASQRNLRVVTLAGGEPLLHPRLPEVIAHIASKGIEAQMLSNGYALTDELLQTYKAAGLGMIYLHVDSLQRRPDAKKGMSEAGLNPLRRKLCERVTRNGIHAAISLTLYQDNLDQLPDVVNFVLGSPNCQRLLVTLCTDFGALGKALQSEREAEGTGVRSNNLDGQEVSNAEVKRLLAERCDMLPFGYVASNSDLSDERWLLYYTFTVHHPNAGHVVLHTGPKFRRVVRPLCTLAKRLTGSMPFGQVMGKVGTTLLALGHGITAGDFKTVGLLANMLWPGARLSQKSLVFQQGPNVSKHGKIEFCKDCPDATVRDGQLVPVCMADILDRKHADGLMRC
jgi:pyruvate-formate lyase-activating enzyme